MRGCVATAVGACVRFVGERDVLACSLGLLDGRQGRLWGVAWVFGPIDEKNRLETILSGLVIAGGRV